MAASMVMTLCRNSRFMCLNPIISSIPQHISVRHKSLTSSSDLNSYESYFPEIKPEYPNGKWSGMEKEQAWKCYEESVELKKIHKIKDRLEHIAGAESKSIYKVLAYDELPGMLKFKQHITKSHIMKTDEDSPLSQSSYYDNITIDNSSLSLAVKLLEDRILQVYEYKYRMDVDSLQNKSSTELFSNYLRSLTSLMGKENPHLHRCQLDEDVRVETFWGVQGYKDIDPWADFQMTSRMSQQIRVERPLPQVLTIIIVSPST